MLGGKAVLNGEDKGSEVSGQARAGLVEREGGGAEEDEATAVEVDDDGEEFGAGRERVWLEGADEGSGGGVEWEVLGESELGGVRY